MNIYQEHDGYNWKFDDPAGLYIAHSGHTKPEEITAHNIGHFAQSATSTVQIEDLEFMGAGLFGEGRLAHGLYSGTKWTGDCYKFAVYRIPKRKRGAVVIMRTDGGGTYFYLNDDIIALETWEHLVQTTPAMLWNICKATVAAYDAGHNHAKKETYKLFLEGRLKKQRRNRETFVVIAPPKEQAAA